jgi:hypothetical protein
MFEIFHRSPILPKARRITEPCRQKCAEKPSVFRSYRCLFLAKKLSETSRFRQQCWVKLTFQWKCGIKMCTCSAVYSIFNGEVQLCIFGKYMYGSETKHFCKKQRLKQCVFGDNVGNSGPQPGLHIVASSVLHLNIMFFKILTNPEINI